VLLSKGIPFLAEIITDLNRELEEMGVATLAEIRGSLSLVEQVEPTAYERAGYVKLLQSYGRI
jgi:hypothetical protein